MCVPLPIRLCWCAGAGNWHGAVPARTCSHGLGGWRNMALPRPLTHHPIGGCAAACNRPKQTESAYPYMVAPLCPGSQLVSVSRRRLQPYIRTFARPQSTSVPDGICWLIPHHGQWPQGPVDKSGLINHGLTCLAITSCLPEQSVELLVWMCIGYNAPKGYPQAAGSAPITLAAGRLWVTRARPCVVDGGFRNACHEPGSPKRCVRSCWLLPPSRHCRVVAQAAF